MDMIKQIMVHRTYDERLKYDEYLRKVEEVKFEMAERYRLHPSNYITKKAKHYDTFRDCNVPIHLCRNREALVALDWNEKRIDIISQNGNEGWHYQEL